MLADKDTTDFILTAFDLPGSFSYASVEAKKHMFESQMPIEDLQKPKVQAELIREFSAFAAVKRHACPGNPTVTSLSSGSDFSQFDIDVAQGFSGSAYL